MDARSPHTARSTRRVRAVRAVAATLALGSVASTAGCLFETTPPKPRPGNTIPPPAQNECIVGGLIQLRNRVTGNIDIAPNWTVLVNWYVPDRTGDGLPDIVSGTAVVANSSGVYEARYIGTDVFQCSVAGRVCTVPETPECCLGEPPCSQPACTVLWGPVRIVNVIHGARVQQNLTIGCP